MSNPGYTQEFKDEAVRQVIERKYPAREVAEHLGVPLNTLYIWIRKARPARAMADELAAQKKEIQSLKAELKRIEEERDILKKAAAYFAKDPEQSTNSSASIVASTGSPRCAVSFGSTAATTTPG